MATSAHTITIAGGIVNYLKAGVDDAPTIVLLHGASYSSANWQEIGTLDLLEQNGFCAVAVDLPGFGKSSATTVHPDSWLRQFLDATKVPRPVLLAASMSGAFSFPLLIKQPERVAGFVAVAPVGILAHQQQLNRITVPVLAIWGQNDQVVSRTQGEMLVKSVPNGRLVVIPNGSHAPYMSDAERFHAELLPFARECLGMKNLPS